MLSLCLSFILAEYFLPIFAEEIPRGARSSARVRVRVMIRVRVVRFLHRAIPGGWYGVRGRCLV